MKFTGFKSLRKCTQILFVLILGITLFVACSSKSFDSDNGSMSEEAYPGGDNSANIDSGGVSGDISDIGEIERKIVKTANIRSETKYFDDALKALEKLCADCGGYVESSSISGNSINTESIYSARNAQYVIRVPAENFDTFITNIGNLMNVTNSSVNASEITDEYYDTVSRLRVLEAQRDSLEKMFESFDDYSDMDNMLKVQDKLYEVIEEIEAFRTKLNIYDSMVSYSEIVVSVAEVVEYSKIEGEQSFKDRIGRAFTESWKNFGEGCQDFAVFLVRAFPVLLIMAVIAAVIVIIVLKSSKKRSGKQKINKSESEKNTDETNDKKN